MEIKSLPYNSYLKETNPKIIIKIKNFGEMKVELFKDLAENTVNNFLTYVSNNDYNKSIFHRIIKGFMIQGGAVNNTKEPIKGEFNSNGFNNDLKHYRGVISMARTVVKDSATSQFFIVHKDSPHLDGEYAGFGGLLEGFEVLDKIAEARTDYMDRPYKDIIIESIELI